MRNAGSEILDKKIDYKFLIENSADVILLTDKSVRLQYFSPSFRQITGYTSSDVIGKKLLKFIHPDDSEVFRKTLSSIIKNEGSSFKSRFRFLMKDSKWKSFDLIGKYIKDNSKKFILISMRSLNDHIMIENEPGKKDQVYETILRNFPHGTVTLYNREFRYIFCDGLELKRVNMTSEKIIGKTIYDILPKEKAEYLKQFLEPSFIDGKEYEYEIENQGRYYKLITLPIIDGNGKINECLAMTQNITEMKNAEEKIRKSEEKLKLTHKVANIGSWEWDFKNNEFNWSDELYEFFGKDKNFNPAFENYINFFHKDDRETVVKIIKESIKNKSHFKFDCRVISKDSKLHYQHIQGDIFVDDSDQSEKVIGVCYDITEKKKFEDHLIDTNIRLKDMQNELIKSEKLAAIGRVAYNMAHEIRNPLANIKASSQILESKFKDKSGIENYLNIIIRNTDNADRIIKDLLDYSSPKELQLQKGDLIAVLKETKKLVEARCRKKNIKFTLRNKLKFSPPVMIHEKKLGQAFQNFIFNSIDSIEKDGKILVMINYAPEDKNFIQIIFEDTGYGISKENIDKILEPFFTTKSTGTGLGLSIAHQILCQHNSTFEIFSEEKKGTKIIINFPLLHQ